MHLGMLLVNRLNDPRTNWNAKAGSGRRQADRQNKRFFRIVPGNVRFKSDDLGEIERLRSKLGEEAFSNGLAGRRGIDARAGGSPGAGGEN